MITGPACKTAVAVVQTSLVASETPSTLTPELLAVNVHLAVAFGGADAFWYTNVFTLVLSAALR